MKIASSRMLLLQVLLLTAASSSTAVSAFVLHHPAHRRILPTRPLLLSSDNNNNDDGGSIDDLRRLLEASWNATSMGCVPTTPEQAAEACASALQQAMVDTDTDTGRVYLVDLRLPQYEITAGTNLYDEVLAVEFCTALSTHLPGRSEILVRDGTVLKTVTRVLNAREGVSSSSVTPPPMIQQKQEPGAAAEPETKSPPPTTTQVEDTEFFDDFADFKTIGGGGSDDDPSPSASSSSVESDDDLPTSNAASSTPSSLESTTGDVDSFRAQLDRTFYNSESLASSSEIAEEERLIDTPSSKAPTDGRPLNNAEKRYRLASLFGDATLSKGPDMIDDVAAAVSANAKPTENEDSIIILSPVSPEEMIAIRALVGKYKATKKIILVNCKLEPPLPRELIGAETVYSILPLIAKPSNTADENQDAPKVVVLRRYPRDWEVYVDVGDGFDLAASVPDGSIRGNQGPAMEWISSAVKRYLQSR